MSKKPKRKKVKSNKGQTSIQKLGWGAAGKQATTRRRKEDAIDQEIELKQDGTRTECK
mgnify:CR=1 FL=1